MCKIIRLATKIAPKRTTILIEGESGTGKEVIARYIHNRSHRADGPFVAVNCAALPENLLESELFGHERGAFTGAIARKRGKFEMAHNGTLLLDEISEMALSLQAKFLRVLQEREIDRVGGQSTIPVDVRVVATTNRDLKKETERGAFRLDLYYRLNVVPIVLTPLRERKEDLVPLAEYFLHKHAQLNSEKEKSLAIEAKEFLSRQSWPGNIRELENLMERATLLIDEEVIRAEDLAEIAGYNQQQRDPAVEGECVVPLKEMEKKMILNALRIQDGNRTHAAKILGISVRTLRNKLNEYKQDLHATASATDL
jgi:two-component system response regulator FlrC